MPKRNDTARCREMTASEKSSQQCGCCKHFVERNEGSFMFRQVCMMTGEPRTVFPGDFCREWEDPSPDAASRLPRCRTCGQGEPREDGAVFCVPRGHSITGGATCRSWVAREPSSTESST